MKGVNSANVSNQNNAWQSASSKLRLGKKRLASFKKNLLDRNRK